MRSTPLILSALLALCLGAETVPGTPGELVTPIISLDDPEQSYALYLPSRFRSDRTWPILFVFDPRARGSMAAELFLPAAEEHGWIVMSSNNSMSDGPWEPNERVIRAMWNDALRRYPIDPGRIYAAGFSGGSAVAWVLAQATRRVAGIISAGARPVEGIPYDELSVAHYGAAGTTDFNYLETKRLDDMLAAAGSAHWVDFFDGPHSWFPEELAAEALLWMELQAMRAKRRALDSEFAGRAFERFLAKARSREEEGDPVHAFRLYEQIAAGFEGLVVLDPVLEAKKALRRQADQARREETKWDGWQQRTSGEALAVLVAVAEGSRLSPLPKLRREIGLDRLLAQAKRDDYGGMAARRVLARIRVHTGFYLMRDLLAKREYARVEEMLSIAMEIREDPVGWYNLACARARLGRQEQAIDALTRAVETGFRNAELAETDADLESLRNHADFALLLERMRAE